MSVRHDRLDSVGSFLTSLIESNASISASHAAALSRLEASTAVARQLLDTLAEVELPRLLPILEPLIRAQYGVAGLQYQIVVHGPAVLINHKSPARCRVLSLQDLRAVIDNALAAQHVKPT